ncbi:MAG: hypothetical protein MJZ18_01950 [Bacteroidales bacterium]|nr:hypothetical protein [Bacteroidales bacterium]
MANIKYEESDKKHWDIDYYVPLKYIDDETNIDMEVFYAYNNVWITAAQIAEFYSIPIETVEKVLQRLEKNKKKDYDKFSLECCITRDIDGVHSETKEIRYGFLEMTQYFNKRKEGSAPLSVKKFFWWQLNIINQYGIDPEDKDYYEQLRKNPPKESPKINISLPFITKIPEFIVKHFGTIILLLAIVPILGILVYYNLHSGYGSLLVEGEDPQLTYKSLLSIFGIIITLEYLYITEKKKGDSENIKKEYTWIKPLIIALIITIAYSFGYRYYYDGVKEDYLKTGYESDGIIYEKEEIEFGRIAMRVGIDKKHTFKHIVNRETGGNREIGDTVKILVSGEYSRINKVIDWGEGKL